MDIKTALSLDTTVKGLEITAELIKVYKVQNRKGWFFQDAEIQDNSGRCKLSISYGQEDPFPGATCLFEKDINSQIKCVKCGIGEYNGKKSLKTSHFEVGGGVVTPEKTPIVASGAVSVPNSTGVDWDGKERRSYRAMCLSYAKDMLVADKIDIKDIVDMATNLFNFIYIEERKTDAGVNTDNLSLKEKGVE